MSTIATSDGVCLHYTDGGGPPVVLIAGFTASAETSGRDSQLWPCEHATASAAMNSRAPALVLDNCGHAATIDQPDQVNEALAKFLAGLA